MSGFKECLSKALNSTIPEESIKFLNNATEVLKVAEKTDITGILPSLQKIGKNIGLKSYLPLIEIYSELVQRISKLNYNEQNSLLSDVHGLCQTMHGCYNADKLLATCEEVIKGNNKMNLDVEIVAIFELPSYVDERIGFITNQINQGLVNDLSLMVNFLSECTSLNLQFQIFEEKFEGFLVSIEKKINGEIVLGAIKILDNFVFPRKYSLKISDKETGLYELTQPKFSPKILKTCLKVIDYLVAFEVTIGQQALGILERLWDEVNYEVLFDISKILLGNIAAEGGPDYKFQASQLLYKIMNLDIKANFKYALEADKVLRPLFDSLDYKPKFLDGSYPEEVFDIIGYALNANIKAGENFDYFINIEVPNSVLVWGFVCLFYDIGMKITRISDNSEILPETRFKCDSKPATGHLVLGQTGLYQLTWVNSYSWLNFKQIRYRVTVYSPSKVETKPKEKIIQVINETNMSNLIPLGIWKKPIVQVYSQGSITEIPSISTIYDILSMYPENSQFSIGIVGPSPLHVPKLKVASLCTCTDSDALLLLGFDIHGPHSIISVVNQEGLRVSVGINRSKVFSSSSDLTIPEELGNLLNIFGPSFVFIAGDDINIKSIEKQLEDFTSTEIIQESYLRVGNDLMFKAASKLFAYSKELYRES